MAASTTRLLRKHRELKAELEELVRDNRKLRRDYKLASRRFAYVGDDLSNEGYDKDAIRIYTIEFNYINPHEKNVLGIVCHNIGVGYENLNKFKDAVAWYTLANDLQPHDRRVQKSYVDGVKKFMA
jgi:hypothetical protein